MSPFVLTMLCALDRAGGTLTAAKWRAAATKAGMPDPRAWNGVLRADPPRIGRDDDGNYVLTERGRRDLELNR